MAAGAGEDGGVEVSCADWNDAIDPLSLPSSLSLLCLSMSSRGAAAASATMCGGAEGAASATMRGGAEGGAEGRVDGRAEGGAEGGAKGGAEGFTIGLGEGATESGRGHTILSNDSYRNRILDEISALGKREAISL